MSIGSESGSSALENLSALTDGELDSAEVARACGAWRDDGDARRTWHAYQLIGDVLRSEDLSSTGHRDAAFLMALRERLADEPVVLAPEAIAPALEAQAPQRVANASRNSRWSWMAPSAVAAGFVLVTGAVLVTRGPVPMGGGSEPLFARAGIGASPTAQMVNVSSPTLAASDSSLEPQATVLTGKMLRDARVDLYLSAHKQFAGSSALGVPSGFLRNAAAESPSR